MCCTREVIIPIPTHVLKLLTMIMFCRQVTAERDRDKDYYYKEYRRESGDERMAKVTLDIFPLGY